MKKLFSFVILLISLSIFSSLSGSAEGNNLFSNIQWNKDAVSGKITIEGYVGQASGSRITLRVINPSGSIDYIGQTTSGEEGAFMFSFMPYTTVEGKYRAELGGEGISNVYSFEFSYLADTQQQTPEDNHGTTPVSNVDHSVSKIEVDTAKNIRGVVTPKIGNDPATALAVITLEDLNKALEQQKESLGNMKSIVIDVQEIQGAKQYSLELPGTLLNQTAANKKITIITAAGTIVVPENMLAKHNLKEESVQILIGSADPSQMNRKMRDKIGDRRTIQLTVMSGGKTIAWSNPDTQVSVELEYKPTSEELKDTEHITVWYIDESGRTVSIPNGRYNPATGKVSFKTSHFSIYTVAYVTKTFNDLSNYSWARKQIEVMASKEIIKGVTEATFNPGTNITRAEFMDALVKTLGLTAGFTSNFDDISKSSSYYESVGIARKLGITAGTGSNKFSPNAYISRQQMSVFVAKAMEVADKLATKGSPAELKKFVDNHKIASYAQEAMATLCKEGIIVGTGAGIDPYGKVTRAQTAVIMYKLYNK